MVKSCTTHQTQSPGFFSHSDADYLQNAMTATLDSSEVCFDFYVQKFKDSESTPIEHSTVEWLEAVSPPIHVAKIIIPAQRFASVEQMHFCENLSFTPWHTLPEHKPLGAVNRTRRTVYTAISKTRHGLNGVSRSEPNGDERFE